jgi:hypothetical protein
MFPAATRCDADPQPPRLFANPAVDSTDSNIRYGELEPFTFAWRSRTVTDTSQPRTSAVSVTLHARARATLRTVSASAYGLQPTAYGTLYD